MGLVPFILLPFQSGTTTLYLMHFNYFVTKRLFKISTSSDGLKTIFEKTIFKIKYSTSSQLAVWSWSGQRHFLHVKNQNVYPKFLSAYASRTKNLTKNENLYPGKNAFISVAKECSVTRNSYT